MRKWVAVAALVMFAFGIGGCAALIVGSVVGSLDLAGYEYANAGAAPAPQPQPSAQPTLSLSNIE
jgi:hypothetical protein